MANSPTLCMLLRLRAESALAGELVGHVEVVETGEIVAVRSVGDFARLIQRLATPAGERAGC